MAEPSPATTAQLPRKKPLITANMVTFARVLAMPLVVYFFYQPDQTGKAIALALGILVGATDFVDGWLARKYGPTLLGGLMDPIADKVFIAVVYVPFADEGYVPRWTIAALFTRELLITALRTAYLLRGVNMKTSYLGKLKTWFQMQGAGMIFTWILVGHERMWTPIVVMLGLSTTVTLVHFAIKRTLWRGMLMWALTSLLYFAIYDWGQYAALTATVIFVLIPTWLSGADYFIGGIRQLRLKSKGLLAADRVRITASLALPAAITWLMYLDVHVTSAWGLVLILSSELAIGGLDNLLAAHEATASAKLWGARTLGAVGLLAAAIAAHYLGAIAAVPWLIWTAVAVTALGGALEFVRGADYYLDKRVRAAAMR